MHILMIAPQPFFRPRGTPFSVLHRLRALSKLGHTVDLVTYPFGESPTIPGLQVVRTGRPPLVHDVGIGPSVAKIMLDIPLFRAASRLARRNRYDLIHTHEEAGVLGARLGRLTGIPHLYDMHSSLPQQFSNFRRFNWEPVVRVFRRLERYTLDGADGVIAICPELRDHVAQSGYRGPVALIENTLDFDPPELTNGDLTALRHDLDVGHAPVVLYTGTLEAYQGLDLLIAAAALVAPTHPGVRFVLVGGTVSQIASLRETTAARGLAQAFVFVPAVQPEQVFAYLRMADVLVTTRSRGTNTPLKIYQYLRAGKPIVATAIRSHTQVLRENSAELVEPTPEGIASGLRRVLDDPNRAHALARGATVLARDEYSEAVYMERLADVLERTRSHRRSDVPVVA